MAKNDKKSKKAISNTKTAVKSAGKAAVKPAVKAAVKGKDAKVSKKPEKTTVAPAVKTKPSVKPVKSDVKSQGVKASPKTVDVKKSAPVEIAAATKAPKAKKSKKGMDDDDLMFSSEDDFDEIDTTGFDDFKNKTAEELEEIRKLLGDSTSTDDEVEVALRDAEGRLYCKTRDCDELSSVDGYCRYHYIKMWKRIQLRKKILTDGKLEKYIEELTQRYPDKYIEMIRDDLRSEKKFLEVIQELEIEDMNEDNEGEDDQALIDEVRGITPAGDTDDDSF